MSSTKPPQGATTADLVVRMDEAEVPMGDARVYLPTVERLWHDDVADRYAVRIDPNLPGGCMIYAEYRGVWTANPWSSRALVATLIAEADTLRAELAAARARTGP